MADSSPPRASQILFLKDTNGDNMADEIKPLIKGFNPSSLTASSQCPRWGLDGCVRLQQAAEHEGDLARLRRECEDRRRQMAEGRCPIFIFRLHKRSELQVGSRRTGVITPTAARANTAARSTTGATTSTASNRNPVMFAVMPYEAMLRESARTASRRTTRTSRPPVPRRAYPLESPTPPPTRTRARTRHALGLRRLSAAT